MNNLRSVINPSTEEELLQINVNDQDALSKAFHNASMAYSVWKNISIRRRITFIMKWQQWIEEHETEFIDHIVNENGKPRADAAAEVQRGLEVFHFALSSPTYLSGAYSNITKDLSVHTRKEAIGVCVGIAPFNFPLMIPCWMAPLAIVCGNSFILKASEKVPSAAILLERGAREVGLPTGIFQVVQGEKEIVTRLCIEPCVRAISFVGSTKIGKIVHQLAQDHGKITQMNMGAKNHAVVLDDANVETTSSAIVSAAVGGAGQRCMALSVVVLVGNVDHILKAILDKIDQLDLVDVGPLIDMAAKERVLRLVDATTATKLRCNQDSVRDKKGFYVNPIVLDNVLPSMPVYEEELFAPVLCCVRVETLDEAIQLVNNNAYGNGTSIFTSNIHMSQKYERDINVGQIGVNVPIPVPPPYFSWTSSKDSFLGQSHIYGPETFEFYTTTKTVMSKIVTDSDHKVQTSMPST